MSYIYINEDDGQVISNDSKLEAQLGYTLERSVTHVDSAIENPTADNMGGTIDYCTKLTDLLKSIMVFPMFLSNINQMDLPATWQGSGNTILSPETMLPATPGRRWQTPCCQQ